LGKKAITPLSWHLRQCDKDEIETGWKKWKRIHQGRELNTIKTSFVDHNHNAHDIYSREAAKSGFGGQPISDMASLCSPKAPKTSSGGDIANIDVKESEQSLTR
jgi:hypothetical protein